MNYENEYDDCEFTTEIVVIQPGQYKAMCVESKVIAPSANSQNDFEPYNKVTFKILDGEFKNELITKNFYRTYQSEQRQKIENELLESLKNATNVKSVVKSNGAKTSVSFNPKEFIEKKMLIEVEHYQGSPKIKKIFPITERLSSKLWVKPEKLTNNSSIKQDDLNDEIPF